ncbi:MAG: Nucleoside ABC transporter membrane protein [Caldanaerobacter subterraneus]|jgi:simple sugar transport system permease protein|uniref:ABC transporter permease n=1 Tax=Caldanaerobacter subterraneus TaxID=911092 RepID=A0A101E557_9THEO|nr:MULTISPECIES: ABC transporter permease [Caldanaerobacter]KUK09044.1 MAG: Nucleoside ABC transporter membrane protein [Caldanaerobacter subterraneus]MDI3518799.1 ral nucleoside transport system permease protein [Caldanaerobacter sp.]MDK2793732.1 ral nucleoside transport system permease protein [Caldanaerobacter sp.]TCO63254.1 nucleoside ABC transporter membrane protein [Caldanaerobacter subterraneus]HBT50202.1 ABC transporter permease [Caldanaerobacter subterraneus]
MDFIVELIASSLRMTVPILLTGIGAVYTERAGVVNIGLEGMMIVGSFWGALGSFYFGPYVGFLMGMSAGMALALIHAVASVTFRVNQIVSGVALNILAFGSSRFLSQVFFKMATTSPHVKGLRPVKIPVLGDTSPIIVLAFILVPFTAFILEKTVFGLRLKSVGENPLAADTLGVNVFKFKYAGVLLSGLLAGLAGTYLSLEHTGMYVEGMTQGKGFIALAAMIFGNWTPYGTMWASLLFGFAESLSFRVVESNVIPYQFIKMIPYLLTLAVLAGVVRKSTPPAADGIPYEREMH